MLELGPNDFFPDLRTFLALFHKAADNITTVSSDSLVIQCEGTDENSHLKEEIGDNADAGHEAEVLQRRHISQHADEESQSFTSAGCENRRSNVFKSPGDSLFDARHVLGYSSFGSRNQENVVDTNGQNEERYNLSRDHGQLLIGIVSQADRGDQRPQNYENTSSAKAKLGVNRVREEPNSDGNVEKHQDVGYYYNS